MTPRPVTQAQYDRLARAATRRTRVALMGEFSVGKSTLLNLIMAREVATTQVTATHVPAIWLRRGPSEDAVLFGYDRSRRVQPLDPNVPMTMDSCAIARIEVDDEALDRFDLIDTPGISDPMMRQSPLGIIAGHTDFVIWCTTAVQAWRQSEVATWERLPERLRAQSILVVTGVDRLSKKDRKRVLTRVKEEAGKLFRTILPISSPDAAKALEMEDPAAAAQTWQESGGAALIEEIETSVAAMDAARDAQLARYQVRDPAPVVSPDSPAPDAISIPDPAQDSPEPNGLTDENQHSADTETEENMSTDISGLKDVTAFIGGCLVDSETGLMLASEGGNGLIDLEVASAANTEVVKAKLAAMNALAIDDHIEDILITLGTQYHLIRPLAQSPTVFLYVALDKKAANLGMARLQVKKVEQTLSI
ncbi:hypothetical protein FHS89_002480 [Rubricella aquisinus]|uniref:Dynamin N-terminal domain-containing protein n=1 Tax=Rubricella aquisinus TaxID=2028108 RepID=A0A840WN19_9RHOB|nr:dynamin family protein [Rubricella aquisinus]MBB5516449.1 hypothetical protein [Rubricella aquisinus]